MKNGVMHNMQEFEATVSGLDEAKLLNVEVGGQAQQGFYAIYNTTKQQLENVVPVSKTNLLQHQEVFGMFSKAVKAKGLSIESASMKNFGGRVVAEVLFKDAFVPDGDTRVQLGLRVENNYAARSGQTFRASAYGERMVCSNGMILTKAIGSEVTGSSIKAADLEKKFLEFITKTVSGVKKFGEVIESAKLDEFESLDDMNEAALGELHSKKLAEEVIKLYEGSKLTRYTLYNAITSYATFSSKSEDHSWQLQKRAQRVLTMPAVKLTRRSWEKDEE